MSWEWGARSQANHLHYEQGAEDTPGYPYSKIGFFKLLVKPALASGQNMVVLSHAGSSNNNNYSQMGPRDYDTVEWAASDVSHETVTGRDISLGLNTNQWYGIGLRVTSATDRKVYIAPVGSAFTSNTHTTDAGSTVSRHRVSIGASRRGGTPTLGSGFPDGRIARCAIWWGTALTDQNFQDMFDGTIEPSDLPTNLYGYWKGLNGALTDGSGNSRTLTMAGTVSSSTDEPFTEAVKKLKILVHPDAATGPASGVEGIVWAAGGIAGAEYGEFTGKTFEAATEGTGDAERAVLLVPVADFNGGALAVDDVVPCLVRNATYTTGLISGTVIEE